MTSLKILLDARMVSENIHGIGRYVTNLARGLHRLGHRVTILTSNDKTHEMIGIDTVENVIPCLLPFAHPLEALELSQASRRGQFDIHHFPSFSVPAIVPKRTVVTIHDLIHLYPPVRLAHQIYFKTVVKQALRSCEKIIAVSAWTKKDLVDKLNTSENKITVVRNGLENIWFQKPAASESPLTRTYILALSNPKPHKNLKTLLAACENLWNQKMDFSLALSLGGNDLPADFKILPNHRTKIKILKNLSAEDLLKYFDHAQVVVSPSFYEGFDYPAAEGLALHKTVLISRGSAHDEFKAENLHFYSPADGAESLAQALLPCLNEKAKVGSHNITTLDDMLNETLAVYAQV